MIHVLGGVRIYDGCEFLIESDNCSILIGSKTTIGNATFFCGESNTSISIVDKCLLSRSINIDASNFHSVVDLESKKRISPPKNVTIGNNVWIGFYVSINKGTVINDNSMLAIKSLLTGKEFPENVIICGVQAKVLKENITWNREKLSY